MVVFLILLATASLEARSSKILFPGCGGICLMDPEPGAVPVPFVEGLNDRLPKDSKFHKTSDDGDFIFDKGALEYVIRVSWSPDGSKIGFISTWGTNGQNSLYTIQADGSGLFEVATQPSNYALEPVNSDRTAADPDSRCCRDALPGLYRSEIAWSPDGSEFVFADLHLLMHIYKADGQFSRSFVPPITSVPVSASDASVYWSPDGLIYISDGGYNFTWTIDPYGSGMDSLDVRGREFEMSPDGSTLAYTSLNIVGNAIDFQIDLMDLESNAVTYLTEGRSPEWSPDSQRIAFLRREGATITVNTIYADGSGEQTLFEYGEIPVNQVGDPIYSRWRWINLDWSPWLDTETGVTPATWGEIKSAWP